MPFDLIMRNSADLFVGQIAQCSVVRTQGASLSWLRPSTLGEVPKAPPPTLWTVVDPISSNTVAVAMAELIVSTAGVGTTASKVLIVVVAVVIGVTVFSMNVEVVMVGLIVDTSGVGTTASELTVVMVAVVVGRKWLST